MTEPTLFLVAIAVGVFASLVILGEARATNHRLRSQVSELTAKVGELEKMNWALQEALAVVQRELAQARADLECERNKRDEMQRLLDSLQQQLIRYQMYYDLQRTNKP